MFFIICVFYVLLGYFGYCTINENSDSNIDGISELRMDENLMKGIKGKTIILAIFGVSDGDTEIMNRLRSP